EPKDIDLGEIGFDNIGNVILVKGVIDRVAQTEGPTLFFIDDGTGTFTFKGFFKPGERAYPEFEEGDVVSIKAGVKEYNGVLEGDIIRLEKVADVGKIKKQIEDKQR